MLRFRGRLSALTVAPALVALAGLMILSAASVAQKPAPRLQTVFEDSAKTTVWGFDFLDEDTMVVNLKDGRMLLYKMSDRSRRKVDIPKPHQIGQGGLLDVLYDADSGYVFWTFSEKRGKNVVTSLARGRYKGQGIDDIKVIFRSQVVGDGGRHFGSRLVLKGKHLYMTIGDRGERDNSQLLSNHNGTVVRLTLDGKAVADNPFVGKKGALPEIFSYGHRNPQGIDVHPETGEVFSDEYGPRGGDELNLVRAGKNYGWPVITYGKEYWGPKIGPTHKVGMEQPIVYWTPSISPSGMVFYRGDKIKDWKGDIFLAVLGDRHLRRLVLEGDKVIEQEVLFEEQDERIRSVRNSPDGYLYFSTDSGKIVRVLPPSAKGE